MQDGLQAMVARIDERTEHIQTDVAELKVDVKDLAQSVNSHTEKLAVIKQRLDSENNCQRLTTKQKAGAWGAIVAFVAAVIAAVAEYLRHR
ncbi:hypothetical protein MUP59_00630 [Candidatus Bathyarchaeota archaeon]|nr:hypothetical protein [Candidatus Bathyarchaeota archaeon]